MNSQDESRFVVSIPLDDWMSYSIRQYRVLGRHNWHARPSQLNDNPFKTLPTTRSFAAQQKRLGAREVEIQSRLIITLPEPNDESDIQVDQVITRWRRLEGAD